MNPQPNINWRRCCAITLHWLRKAGLLKDAVVVLIGSYARNTASWRSDVDILVLLSDPHRPKLQIPHCAHLHFEDIARFKHQVEEGDDYAISSVRYGKLLYDRSNYWKMMRQVAETAKWPDWREKIGHAERRIRLGDKLLITGDIDAAAEEYLFAATQLSRAILLRRGIYPFSRPELSRQLFEVDQRELAADIQTLIEGRCDEEHLHRISQDLKEALNRRLAEANEGRLSTWEDKGKLGSHTRHVRRKRS